MKVTTCDCRCEKKETASHAGTPPEYHILGTPLVSFLESTVPDGSIFWNPHEGPIWFLLWNPQGIRSSVFGIPRSMAFVLFWESSCRAPYASLFGPNGPSSVFGIPAPALPFWDSQCGDDSSKGVLICILAILIRIPIQGFLI